MLVGLKSTTHTNKHVTVVVPIAEYNKHENGEFPCLHTMSQKHLQVISLILKFEKCGWLDLNIFSMASLPVVKRQRNVLNIEIKLK